MKKLKTYYVNPDDDNLVYKISFVEDPAIEQSFVYFGKEKPVYVSMESDEKRMVYSPVLIPSFPIYRRMDDQEFNVVFEASAIEQLAHNYLRDGFQREWSRDHESDIKGVTTVESWIKTSQEDKSVALGLNPDLPLGTWFIAASVQSDDVWEAIKEGNWTGISVEALVTLDDNKLAKEDMTKEENVQLETVEVNEGFWQRLKDIIKGALGSPEQPEEQAEAEAEEVVEDIKEEVEETPVDENLEEETPVEEVAEDAAAAAEEIAEEAATDPNEEKAALEETISKLEEKVEELNSEIENLKKQNQKLSKQPSTKEIKAGAQRTHAETMEILRQLHGQK
jgi:hypothetical protein